MTPVTPFSFVIVTTLFLAMSAQAAGGGASTLGQSTGPGASAPGMAASDPPKARSGKAAGGPRRAASGSKQGNSSNRERPSVPRSPASAP